MKKVITMILAALIMLLAAGCSNNEAETSKAPVDLPVASNMAGNVTSEEVCDKLKEAGLSNVVVFNEWVADFAGSAGDDAGLADEWISPDSLVPDLTKCMEGWENHHDYSDSDCRMTAFLLMDGLITSDKTDSEYTGSYLMFDVDAIENVTKYEVIKKNLSLFTTLFGDRDPQKGEDPSEVFGRIWNDYGFKINNDKVSLLSVVVYDPDFDQTFVGHTGVLVDEGDSYLFVEKIAFEQPYQVTRVKDVDQLLELLGHRPEYFGSEGDQGPFIYLNGEYLGVLSKQE